MLSPTATGWIALTEFAVIHASGADARDFLHKQLTQDVQNLALADSRLAGYCNAQGRLYAVLRVVNWQDGIALITTADTLETLIKRLRMFVLRAKVKLDNVTSQVALYGIVGDSASAVLATRLALPQNNGGVSTNDDLTVIRVADALVQRYLVLATPTASAWLANAMAEIATLTATDWRLHDIFAGTPTLFAANSETFTPQMVNLDLIDGVSFTKGCYPGQEIVARTHYLGRVKRRMMLAQISGNVLPPPGAGITSPKASDPNAGRIVDAVSAEDGIYALVSLQTETMEQGHALHVSDAPHSAITVIRTAKVE